MRFVLVTLIWLVIVGGLKLYTERRDTALARSPRQPVAEIMAMGTFALEITPTFGIEPDPFALTTTDAQPMEIRVNGITLAPPADGPRANTPLRFDNVENIRHGHNEIFIRASPPFDEGGRVYGIRVRCFHDAESLTDQTIWAEGGATVVGTVGFAYEPNVGEPHDH